MPDQSYRKYFWCQVSSDPRDLYPNLTETVGHDRTPLKPSSHDIKIAQHIVLTNFRVYSSGNIAIGRNEDIAALVQFTDINDMTSEEKDDLQFLSAFAHRSKKHSNPIQSSSNSWNGTKWKVGWRKSMKPTERIKRYTNRLKSQVDLSEDGELIASYRRVSDILGNMLKNMHQPTFEENQNLMMQHEVPSFSNLDSQDLISELDCSPTLTFTSDNYFDMPHLDQNCSKYTFSVFIPQNKLDGTMAGPDHTLSGDLFAFPHNGIAIDFSNHKGIAKILWNASQYIHCTFPTDKNENYTRLTISLEINSKLANSCDPIYLARNYKFFEIEESSLEQREYLDGLAQLLYTPSP